MDFEQLSLELLNKLIIPGVMLFAGYWLSSRGEKNKNNREFIEKQIAEFYSPMLGLRKKIVVLSELRVDISKATDESWKETVKDKTVGWNSDDAFIPYEKSIEYDNQQLREKIIPLYDQMVNLFTQKYWLANESTKQWYNELIRFVEIWHRWLLKSIPTESLQDLDHKESRLHPFYKNLEEELNKLTKMIST